MARGVAIPPFIRAWVRRNYEHNPNMSLEEMARHAGCTSSAIPHMARREGWLRAPGALRSRREMDVSDTDTTGRKASGTDAVAAALGLFDTAEERRMILDALWLVASRFVAELQAAGDEFAEDCDTPRASGDRARGAQALMTAVRTVEKLMEMEAGLAKAAPARPADEGPEDIDAIRDEIARRIQGMFAGEQAG